MAKHCLNEYAVARTRENYMRINAGKPPDDERIGLVSINFAAKERNTKQLFNVLRPQR